MSPRTTSVPAARARRSAGTRRHPARPQVNGAVRSRKRNRSASPAAGRFILLPSFHSERTREVLLQCHTGKRSDRITLAYHGPDVELTLAALGTTLLAGAIDCALAIDGRLLEPRGDWESVCWYADDDGDYLELRVCLSDTVWIDRQILLSRSDHFALLADAVTARGAGRIDYRLSLPVAEEIAVKIDVATRECRFTGAGTAARVFPLALPQDRVLSTAGSFLERNGGLELTQIGAGRGLYLPLLFDWHPRRRGATADWRSLTVTELGNVVSPDRATGHRLRLGRHQLLVYKSLVPPLDARAVLGHHTWYEALIGVFAPTGDVDPLVMVETE